MWVTSEIPKGSVGDHLLFFIMIPDENIQLTSAFIASFADDTNIWKSIPTSIAQKYHQDQRNKIYLWATTNKMTFNSGKFEHLHFGQPEDISYTTLSES